jgi:hypothetical protein
MIVPKQAELPLPHSISPLSHGWERGRAHADLFGVLKRSFSIRRKLRFRTP